MSDRDRDNQLWAAKFTLLSSIEDCNVPQRSCVCIIMSQDENTQPKRKRNRETTTTTTTTTTIENETSSESESWKKKCTCGLNVGAWVAQQRRLHACGQLQAERELLLSTLVEQGRFVWEPRRQQTLMKTVATTTGATTTTLPSIDESQPLTSTVVQELKKYKRGLSREEQFQLEWNINYQALLHFINYHHNNNNNNNANSVGHISKKLVYECQLLKVLPNGDDFHYVGNLGTWVINQRYKHNHNQQVLTIEQQQLLQQLVDEGTFVWEDNEHTAAKSKQQQSATREWCRHFAALLCYRDEFGSCNVPSKLVYSCTLPTEFEETHETGTTAATTTTTTGVGREYVGHLGAWLTFQRYTKNHLSENNKSNKNNAERLYQLQQLQHLVDDGLLLWDVSHLKVNVIAKQRHDRSWSLHFAALQHLLLLTNSQQQQQQQQRVLCLAVEKLYECDISLASINNNNNNNDNNSNNSDNITIHYCDYLGKWWRKQTMLLESNKQFLTQQQQELITALLPNIVLNNNDHEQLSSNSSNSNNNNV